MSASPELALKGLPGTATIGSEDFSANQRRPESLNRIVCAFQGETGWTVDVTSISGLPRWSSIVPVMPDRLYFSAFSRLTRNLLHP